MVPSWVSLCVPERFFFSWGVDKSANSNMCEWLVCFCMLTFYLPAYYVLTRPRLLKNQSPLSRTWQKEMRCDCSLWYNYVVGQFVRANHITCMFYWRTIFSLSRSSTATILWAYRIRMPALTSNRFAGAGVCPPLPPGYCTLRSMQVNMGVYQYLNRWVCDLILSLTSSPASAPAPSQNAWFLHLR